MVHGLSATQFQDYLNFKNSGRTRGHSLKLLKKRCHLDLRLYFFSETVVNLWNNLDDHLVHDSFILEFS